MTRKVMIRSALCLALLLALVAVYLPAAAQDASASWETTGEVGTVGISSPAAGATVTGVTSIAGTATSTRFSYYKVEYSVDSENWVVVSTDYKNSTAVSQGELDTWDTTTVANGEYWLRAVVVDNTGNYLASGSVAVVVANEAAATPEATEAAATATPEAAATEVVAVPAVAAAAEGWLVTGDHGTVGISAPAAGATLTGVVDVMGTAANEPGKFSYYKVEYSVDGSAWVSVVTDYKQTKTVMDDVLATWDTTTVPDGAYMLRAVVVDNTGNYTETGSVAVTVANAGGAVAPVATEAVAEATEAATPEAAAEATPETAEVAPVALPAPLSVAAIAADASVTGSVEITGTATGVDFSYYKVEYSVDGATWVTVDTDYKHTAQVEAGALATWDTTTVPNGSYMLRAVVVDNTGNYIATEPISVTVANEAAAAS